MDFDTRSVGNRHIVGDGGEDVLDKCPADALGGFPQVSAPDPATTWDQTCRRRTMLGDEDRPRGRQRRRMFSAGIY